jgi:hypothetical protein
MQARAGYLEEFAFLCDLDRAAVRSSRTLESTRQDAGHLLAKAAWIDRKAFLHT